MLPTPIQICEKCEKSSELCVCALLRPLKSRTRVLILQHPQEPDKALGTARLLHLSLPNSVMRIGLSWPNFKKALGEVEATPSRWATLHLGSGIGGAGPRPPRGTFQLVDKKGMKVPGSADQLGELDGIILLDGTWSQAKTLWWRNAWLLKTRRAILVPPKPSLYGKLRKEPRSECLSTLETAAYSLAALGEPAATTAGLLNVFENLLEKFRATPRGGSKPETAAAPRS